MTAKALIQENAAEWVRDSLEEFESFSEQCVPPNGKRRELVDRLDIPGNYPTGFIDLINDFMRLYHREARQTVIDELIQSAATERTIDSFLYSLDWGLDKPSYEFMPPVPRFSDEQDEVMLVHYLVRGALYFNEMLPVMREGGFAAVDAETLYLFQRSAEHALTAYLCLDFYAQFGEYEPPHRRQKQSQAGGKARAEKLYGNTKAYTKQRFDEIRAKGSSLSMSQIAQKIAYELEEKPIESDEPLSNPYDTIYRWVRSLNRAS